MLVIKLKQGERVHVDGPASFENRNSKVMKVAIDAPQSTEVVRGALLEKGDERRFTPTVLNVNEEAKS